MPNEKRTPQTSPKSNAPAEPPAPPEGKPFNVGATTAIFNTVKGAKPTVTLRLKRVLKAPPERIYQAFLDPDALAKWIPPDGFVGKVYHLEPKVGGTYRMSFSTVGGKWTSVFGGKYLELIPNRRIVNTDAFETDDPSMQGTMKVTITLTPVQGGTEIEIVQEGIPAGPAASGSPYGWAQSLDNLARLVEPELTL